MSGFQFIHIESYARSTGKGKHGAHNLASIVNEAERAPDACPHVETPMPPVRLYGCSPTEAAQEAERWAEQAQDQIGRKLRKDGLCLLAGVASLPREREADWPAYRTAIVEHLKQQYGDRLKSVIEHTDEAHPHLHFYAVPRCGERFEMLHAGRQAAYEAKKNGELKGAQNSAYKEAMREWQSDFHRNVALDFGLARLGPARRRLSREEWQREQAATRTLGEAKKIKQHGIKPIEPRPKQQLTVDWDKATAAAGEGKKGFLDKTEMFTLEQMHKAMQSIANQVANVARLDEERRFQPIVEQAKQAEAAAIAGQQANQLEQERDVEAQKRAQLERKNKQLESTLGEISYYAPDIVTVAKARKQAAEAADAEKQENLRSESEKRTKAADIAKERYSRAEFLLKNGSVGQSRQIQAGLSGASSTLANIAAKAINAAESPLTQGDWANIELETIRLAIGRNGQSPESTIDALCDLSPLRVTHEEQIQLVRAVERQAPQLLADFKAHRAAISKDQDRGYNR